MGAHLANVGGYHSDRSRAGNLGILKADIKMQRVFERKERKIREDKLRNDPQRRKLIEDGQNFLGNIKFYNNEKDGKFDKQLLSS